MNAWNVSDLEKMALPPCKFEESTMRLLLFGLCLLNTFLFVLFDSILGHVMAQFYVANGELSCQMYQRSCDLGLGVPFNIASYSLLTIMIAAITGLKPGDFIHTMGDTHIYLNHEEALRQQIQRTPTSFPTLTIKKQVNNIDEFTFDDFVLENYKPQGEIKMKMAV